MQPKKWSHKDKGRQGRNTRQTNAGENYQGQGRQPVTGDAYKEVNMIRNEAKARRLFKVKLETQDVSENVTFRKRY